MKGKLAVLGFLCAAITVGGVYATWTFADGGVPEASADVTVGLAGSSNGTEKGALSVIVNDTTSPLKLLVDDLNNDHKADLVKTGKVIVKFKPSATASQEVKTNGIDATLKITCELLSGDTFAAANFADWKYNDATIFSVATTELTINSMDEEGDGLLKWSYDEETDEFSYVFDVEANQAPFGIQFASDLILDTLDAYNAFKQALLKGQFVFTVSEKI